MEEPHHIIIAINIIAIAIIPIKAKKWKDK